MAPALAAVLKRLDRLASDETPEEVGKAVMAVKGPDIEKEVEPALKILKEIAGGSALRR